MWDICAPARGTVPSHHAGSRCKRWRHAHRGTLPASASQPPGDPSRPTSPRTCTRRPCRSGTAGTGGRQTTSEAPSGIPGGWCARTVGSSPGRSTGIDPRNRPDNSASSRSLCTCGCRGSHAGSNFRTCRNGRSFRGLRPCRFRSSGNGKSAFGLLHHPRTCISRKSMWPRPAHTSCNFARVAPSSCNVGRSPR